MDGEAYPLHRLLSAPVREGPPLDFDLIRMDRTNVQLLLEHDLSENRFPLFGIMLYAAATCLEVGLAEWRAVSVRKKVTCSPIALD